MSIVLSYKFNCFKVAPLSDVNLVDCYLKFVIYFPDFNLYCNVPFDIPAAYFKPILFKNFYV